MTDQSDVKDNPDKSRFEIEIDGQWAFADYRLTPGVITFTHTEVPEALGGKGIGTALIKAGLGAARARGLKVKPVCPFFKAYIERHPEEQDLL